MFCRFCGLEIPIDSKFCLKCGKSLSANTRESDGNSENEFSLVTSKGDTTQQETNILPPRIEEVGKGISDNASPSQKIEGFNGQIELYEDKVIVRRKGLGAFFSPGIKGDREYPLRQLREIQFVNPGLISQGFIRFRLVESDNSVLTDGQAARDNDAVMFEKRHAKNFSELRAAIEERLSTSPSFKVSEGTKQEQKKPSNRNSKVIAGFIILAGLLYSCAAPSSNTPQTIPSQTSKQQKVAVEVQISPDTYLRAVIQEKAGEKSNLDVPRIRSVTQKDNYYNIELVADDNLSKRYIRGGILMKSQDIFAKVFTERKDIPGVRLHWLYPIADERGNAKWVTLVMIQMTKENAATVNWKNILLDNVPKIADEYRENSWLRE